MQATITYLLTEQAQRAQMMATGQPVTLKHVVTEDIPAEMLESRFAKINSDGDVTFDLTDTWGISEQGRYGVGGGEIYVRGKDLYTSVPDSGLTAIHIAEQAITDTCNRLAAKYVERRKESAASEQQLSEQRAKANAEQAARHAADAAKERAKSDFITAWVAEHADEDTRQQFGEGLLCRSVALTLIADAAFAFAGIHDAAKWNDEYCRNRECPCGQKELDCLPSAAYHAWRNIKSGLPEGYTVEFMVAREHINEYDFDPDSDEPTAGPRIYLAKLKIPHGPFTFERTVKLG